MKLDDRAGALLALVEADRAARSRAILEPAERGARAERSEARRAARLRVATAIAEERAAFAARSGAAEARLATARRMARQRRLKALVADGWERLPATLAQRWADAAARETWVRTALEQAIVILPRDPWTLQGPASWSADERARWIAWLGAQAIQATCETAPGIDAGIRVSSRNVELDATVAGLLAERAAVEGRLLHFIAEPQPE